jgi:protoporphyrinogen oxidase
MTRNNVVVGGGIAGLLAALLIAERDPHGRVCLVERENEVGGLLRSFDYGEHGRFDYGMHSMHESGVGGLDELLFGLLPASDWQLLQGNRRDVAGLFFNGRLQHNSLYMDLRHLPRASYEQCIAGFFANLGRDGAAAGHARDHAEARFGAPIAELAVAPAVAKIFKRDPAVMDVMALMLTSLDRIILFDEPVMLDLMKSDTLRARLAYPEQRRLPVARASGHKGYYPRDYGMHRVVDAFHRRLTAAGARILTGAQIQQIDRDRDGIKSIGILHNGAREQITGIQHLYWTAGLPALAPLLGIPLDGGAFDRPLRTIAVNLLLDRDTRMDDLYYFYCYDSGFDTFRVTNFAAYCDNARRAGGVPICVELLVDPASGRDARDYEKQALAELEKFGALAPGTKVLFQKAEPLAYGFPMPTERNIRGLLDIRRQVETLALSNLVMLGILAEPKLFFQKDVAAHAYSAVTARLQERP